MVLGVVYGRSLVCCSAAVCWTTCSSKVGRALLPLFQSTTVYLHESYRSHGGPQPRRHLPVDGAGLAAAVAAGTGTSTAPDAPRPCSNSRLTSATSSCDKHPSAHARKQEGNDHDVSSTPHSPTPVCFHRVRATETPTQKSSQRLTHRATQGRTVGTQDTPPATAGHDGTRLRSHASTQPQPVFM